jgi:hypothetical protein
MKMKRCGCNTKKIGFELLSKKFDKQTHSRYFLSRLKAALINKTANRSHNFTGAMLNFHSMQSTKYMSRWIEEKNKTSLL